MPTTQHSTTRCPVYLHPAAATSRAAVEAIQLQTGLLIITNLGRPAAVPTTRPVTTDDRRPWGGDVA
jgi:hypothetical protein